MKCTNCGCKLSKNLNFCTRCGQKIEKTDKKKRTPTLSDGIPREIKRKKNKYSFYHIILAIMISAITIGFLAFPYSVMVRTAADGTAETFSMYHAIRCLIDGSGRYNPTVFSVALGFGTLLFTMVVPLFQLFAIIAAMSKKSETGMHVISVIITSLSMLLMCVMVPLSCRFVPTFKTIYAREANILLSDITSIIAIWPIAAAVLITALMVTASIITHKKDAIKREMKI